MLVLEDGVVPPLLSSPHVITLPSFFNAANAFMAENTVAMLVLLDVGVVPPLLDEPHAITLPSVFNAANA